MTDRRIRVVVSALDQFIDGIIKKLVLDIVANLRSAPNPGYGTPVDTGWARANWYPSINARISVEPGNAPEGAVGIPAAQPAAVVATGKAGDIFFLQNGVRYIKNLENGTSQQAPEGMVKRAIADVGTFFKQYAGGPR